MKYCAYCTYGKNSLFKQRYEGVIVGLSFMCGCAFFKRENVMYKVKLYL